MTEELNAVSFCPDSAMADVLKAMQEPGASSLQALTGTLETWSSDPRLHLLRGATYASQHDYAHAKTDFIAALTLAPDYAVARFMLGFLELTNGEVELALHAWAPLDALPADDTLRIFKSGLVELVHDRFDDALRQLRLGMVSNRRYPLINHYVAAVIEKIADPLAQTEASVDHVPEWVAGNRYTPPSKP
ncbi:hypothetical protein [Burkholderia sp. BCC1977]|uniref:tetratricopeptide repeat protein n=1 Tax=Burkholderia sp. BCC1977 TaxID=2817440 RepID=UPI002ABE15DB|nr:hypothetical protein [Burkholderia sp. BCC1977]